MKIQTIEVPVDFVIDALQSRYDEVKDLWGNDASESLWEQALQLVEECGLGSNITSPSVYVDNYLINGDFVDRKDLTDCGYRGINTTQCEDGEFISEEDWEEYCQDNAIIYNDEYACLQF